MNDINRRGQTPLLITPRSRQHLEGTLTVDARTTVDAPGSCRVAVEHVTQALRQSARSHLGSRSSVLARVEEELQGIDAYKLSVTTDGVRIVGNNAAAVSYGLHTLAELIEAGDGQLDCELIEDHADMGRRGLYLDCARGKIPTVSAVHALIDRLSRWRYNELQLYIETGFSFNDHPDLSEGLDPFTPGDIEAIRDYAAKRHIRLVGSLASFGHMEWLLSLPDYQHLAELPGHHGYPGGTTLCPTDPRSLQLMRELYSELVPLFDAEDFNICCDETWEIGQGRSKPQADAHGVAQLYIDFVSGLHQILTEDFGKRVNLWADVVLKHPERLGGFPSDAVMLNWEYDGHSERTLGRFAQGAAIREHGYPLVVCPGSNTWMTHGGNLKAALWNVENFVAAGLEQGSEGMLMTDWGDAGHRNCRAGSLLPIAFAGAHAWNGRAVDRRTFMEHFCRKELGQPEPSFVESLEELATPPSDKPWSLYHGLVEPADPPSPAYADMPPACPARMGIGLRKLWTDASIQELQRVADRPDHMPGLAVDRVTGSLASQFELSWDMDRLAAEKMLAEQKVRPASDLSPRLLDVGKRLEAIWLTDHRRSRLDDNLKLIRAAADFSKSAG